MRQFAIMVVLFVVAAVAGSGLGWLAAKPRINAARAQTEELTRQMQTLDSQWQEKLKTASDEIAKLRAELMRTRNDLTRVNADLIKARADLAQAKAALEQITAPSPAAQTIPETIQIPAQTATASSTAAPAPAAPTTTASAALPTREYVIKEGDSFWKIAASQLGSGIRYKEILQLNPNLSPDKPLEIGTKIRIPAR